MARYGPDTGSLEVHTYREGVAAKVGHDLIIEVTKWAASDDGGALELTADPRSLVVREGNRGVKPLTDKDRASIQKTIEKDILGSQEIALRAPRASRAATSRATSRSPARTQPVEFDLHRDGDRVRATISVVQTRWGIKPYRGFMGALKVRDDVEIVLDAAGVLDEHAVEPDRQLAHAPAGGVEDGVGDRRGGADDADLADALGAHRVELARRPRRSTTASMSSMSALTGTWYWARSWLR